jgi:hypothetical protein
MAEPTEREKLHSRAYAAVKRQADLRELRAWMEGRVAERKEHGEEPWAHDVEFLRTTQPIMDWLETEIAEVGRLLDG